MNKDIKRKIFVIGLPKARTSSIQKALLQYNINSVHWSKAKHPNIRRNDESDKVVALCIKKAKEENKNLCFYIDEYEAITQMEMCVGKDFNYWPQLNDVPTLIEQYPNGKFIFNDRNLDNWIRSIKNWQGYDQKVGQLYENILNLFEIKDDEELKEWYLQHKNNMIELFRGKENFLLFDIEKDDAQKLGDFLEIKDFVFPHVNRNRRNYVGQKK